MAPAWLFRFFTIWGLADLVYRVPYWLHKISSYVPKTVAILGFFGWLLLLVYTAESDRLSDEPARRPAATIPASRRLMTAVAARDGKEFCASVSAFEDCLCEEVLEILPKIWRASRLIVRILVFFKMSVLTLWTLLWAFKIYLWILSILIGLSIAAMSVVLSHLWRLTWGLVSDSCV